MIGHSDWHFGNIRFATIDSTVAAVAAVYDLELFVDTEAVIAGFAAASYLGTSLGGATPKPADVAGFLSDYDDARPEPFSAEEQAQAAAAATLALTYNARCGLSMMNFGSDEAPPAWSNLTTLESHRDAYLEARW